MTRLAAVARAARPVVDAEPVVRSFRAMASPVTLTVVGPGSAAVACLDRAERVIREVERTCSRFDPTSALSRANDAPDRWHVVPASCATALAEAARAHDETHGLFDPRILDVLVGWGYDRSLPFLAGGVETDPAGIGPLISSGAVEPMPAWRPQIVEHDGTWRVHLGGRPVDLGGIGKGFAVRWAAAELARAGAGYAIDAGGDCAFGGIGPGGGGWHVGVEDPADPDGFILVLDVTDTGCATSSTRLRRWHVGGSQVHHLVDPRTRRPGGDGLAAVTVVAADPAWSEVWSKSLFLTGSGGIRARAEQLGLAAAWVQDDSTVGTTTALDSTVIWRRAT